jgi:RimJ/RimL family protein N-acetyltransferase
MTNPELRILQPGDEAALEAFLLPHLESSMFLVGNARHAGLEDSGQRYGGAYAAAFEGGEITGVAAHYWNGNLIFQAPKHAERLWRYVAKASGHEIKGFIGPNAQVSTAIAGLALRDADVQLDQTEGLYRLDLSDLRIPEGLDSGQLRARRMEPGDVDLLTGWWVSYSVEALGSENTAELRERIWAGMKRRLDERRTWVLEDQGRRVSMSGFNLAIREAVQVGGVFTPPELRGRGYARAAVAASLLDARAEGAETSILFTGVDNLPAIRAYAALGYRHIGDYRLVLLRSALRVAERDSNPAPGGSADPPT